MPECTPTTENIRHCYIYSAEMYDGTVATPVRIASAEFDRWLAAHDREVAARTLERAAARLTVPVVTEVQLRARAVIDVELLFEADRIRSGTEGSTSQVDSHDAHAELVGRLKRRCRQLEDEKAELQRQLEEARNQ